MEEHNFDVIWSKTILHVNSEALRSFSKEIFYSMCYENLNQIKMIDLTFLQKFMEDINEFKNYIWKSWNRKK